MTSNADIERYSAAVRAATSYAEALTLAAPLIAEAQHHSAAAVALVDLVGESLFDFEESEKLLSDLLAQADHELLAQIGRAAAAVVNIDDLNAAPVAPRFFTDLVGRLQQCCALEPSNAQLAAALASAAHRGGRSFDEVAEGAFAAAISLEPDNPNHRYNRGLFYKTRGRFEESVEDNRQALALGMQNDGAKWNVGIAATASAQGALALETFRGLGLKLELSPAGRAEGTFPTCMFRVAVRPVAERDSQQVEAAPGRPVLAQQERLANTAGDAVVIRSALGMDLDGAWKGHAPTLPRGCDTVPHCTLRHTLEPLLREGARVGVPRSPRSGGCPQKPPGVPGSPRALGWVSSEAHSEAHSEAQAAGRLDLEVRAQEALVHFQHVGPAEHLLRRSVAVGLAERLALGPGGEVGERAPPGLDLVVAGGLRVGLEAPGLVRELHGARAMHLVADEAGALVDQVDALAEAVLEVDLVALGHGDAIGDDDHAPRVRKRATSGKDGRA
jgi:tetratricopeptide (TPR) repeat protein